MIAAAEPMGIGEATPSRQKTIKVWHGEEDDFSLLEGRFSAWVAGISLTEKKYFKKYVYDNPDLTDLDLRQHRAALYLFMTKGEELATDLLSFKGEDMPAKTPLVEKYVLLIDQKLYELRQTLHEWHGNLEDQADVPDSLKQAFRELDKGDLISLDEALAD